MATAKSPFRTPAERQKDREAKRRAILEAAVETFNKHGFHNASLDEVAAKLGVTKPTIYHHVGNKEQILIECFETGIADLRVAMEAARAQPGTARQRLETFMIGYATNAMSEFGRLVNRTNESALSEAGAEAFRNLRAQIDREMRELITEGIEDGSIAKKDVRMTAFALAGALSWTARWYNAKGGLTPTEAATQIVAVLVDGIKPRPEDA